MDDDKNKNNTEPTKQVTPFTTDQMEVIQRMLAETRDSTASKSPNSISMYNLRDPKSIETVNVRRIDGKFVLGFVNFQKDSFKKTPRYWVMKNDPSRSLPKEPYITLILSGGSDEKPVEKEMMLVDYMNERSYYKAKVVNIDVKKVIEDHGILGSSGEYAVAVDDKGRPESRPTILAQVEKEERVFYVELPGFDKPVKFISDFLA